MGSGSSGLAGHLEKLARQAAELDVPAPVTEELTEHIGHPQQLADAALLWREAAAAVEEAAGVREVADNALKALGDQGINLRSINLEIDPVSMM